MILSLGTTLAYVAPELANGFVKEVSVATDVYSFGISIYEILSDTSMPWEDILPFNSDSILLDAMKRGERPDLSRIYSIYSDCISSVVSIIRKCWYQTSDQRPNINEVHYLLRTGMNKG